MLSYCKDYMWLSLLQAISYSEKTYMNTENTFLSAKKAFLHFNNAFLHIKTACNAIRLDLTVLEQDYVNILECIFLQLRGPFLLACDFIYYVPTFYLFTAVCLENLPTLPT